MFFTPLLQGAAQQQAGGSGLFLRNVSSRTADSSITDPGKPANTQATDLLIAVFTSSLNPGQSAAAPAGWTAIPGATISNPTGQIYAWWALGSVASTTFTGGGGPTVAIYAFAGADTTNPIRGAATNTSDTTTIAAPSVVANAGDSLLQVWFDWQSITLMGAASPGGVIDRVNAFIDVPGQYNNRTVQSTLENLTTNGATLAQTRTCANFTGKRSVTIAIASATAQQVPRTFFPRKVYRARQPQGPVEIDWSNPITRGLVICTHAGNNFRELVTNKPSTITSATYAPTKEGVALMDSASTFKIQTPVTDNFGEAVTWLVGARLDTFPTNPSRFIEKPDQEIFLIRSTGVFEFQRLNTALVAAQIIGASTGQTAPAPYSTYAARVGDFATNLNASLFVNGISQTLTINTAGTGTRNTTANPYFFANRGVDDRQLDGRIYFAYRWNRALSDNEIKSISANPYQIFKHATQVISFAAQAFALFRQRLHWTRQPQGAVAVDWSNPITKGLAWAGFPGSGVVTKTGTVGQEASQAGKSWRFSGVSASRVNTGFTPPTTGACTLVVLVDALSFFSNNPVFATGDRCTISISATGFAFFTYNGTTWNPVSITTQLGDGPAVVIGRHTGANNLIDYRVVSGSGFGTKISASTPCGPRTHTEQPLTIGGEVENPTRTSNCQVFMGAFFNRALSDAEVASISANPWQIFRPTTRTIGTAVISGVTIYRPTSDITTTGWTASTGSVLYDMIDEVIPSDIDYILSPDVNAAPGPATFGIGSAPAGTYVISLRAMRTSSVGQIRALLKDSGGTTVGTSSWQTITGAFTTYNFSVTTTGTAAQLTIEVQP